MCEVYNNLLHIERRWLD